MEWTEVPPPPEREPPPDPPEPLRACHVCGEPALEDELVFELIGEPPKDEHWRHPGCAYQPPPEPVESP